MKSKNMTAVMGLARVKVVVSVELLTMDGVQDEEQIIGRENMGWSRVMEGVSVTPGSDIAHMDETDAAKFISQNVRDFVSGMLEEGYNGE